MRELRARAERRGIRSAPKRILASLYMCAIGNPPIAIADRTRTEIAAELVLTREAVYRAHAGLGPRVFHCHHRDHMDMDEDFAELITYA